jgi:hypothetical protein
MRKVGLGVGVGRTKDGRADGPEARGEGVGAGVAEAGPIEAVGRPEPASDDRCTPAGMHAPTTTASASTSGRVRRTAGGIMLIVTSRPVRR